MERDGDPTEEGRNPEDDHTDPNKWFFDLPNEAGERAEATQRELRSQVEENYEEARRRRELFRPVEADLIEEPEAKKKKSGGLFGRKKKQESDGDGRRWASPGGMWTLDPTLAHNEGREEEPAGVEPGPEPNAIRRALQEAGEPVAPEQDEWSTESFSEFAEARSEPVEAPGGLTESRMEYVEAPQGPKRSRWEEMFGSGDGPAFEETSSVEGMKALWGTSAGKTRRLAESTRPAVSAHDDDEAYDEAATEEEGAGEVTPVFEAPAAAEAVYEEQSAAPALDESEPERDEQDFEAAEAASVEFGGEEQEPEETPAPRSRWDEMMSRPAGEDTIEAMRKWSTSRKSEEAEQERPIRRIRLDERDEDDYATSLDEFARDVDLPEEEPTGGLFGKIGRMFRRKDAAEAGDLEYVAEASGEWLPPAEDADAGPVAPAEPRGGWLRAMAGDEPETVALEALEEPDELTEAVAAGFEEDTDDDDVDSESMFHTSRRWQDDLLAGRTDASESGEEAEHAEVDKGGEARTSARAAYFAADLEITPGRPEASDSWESEAESMPAASLAEEEDAWEPEEFESVGSVVTEVPEEVVVAAGGEQAAPIAEEAFYAVDPQPEPEMDDGWTPAGEDTRRAPEIRDFYADLEDSLATPQMGAARSEPVGAVELEAPTVETASLAPAESWDIATETAEEGIAEPAEASGEEPKGEPTGWAGWQARVGGGEEDAGESPWASFGSAASGGGDEPPRAETTEAQPEEPDEEDDPWAHFRATQEDEPEPAVASNETQLPDESEDEPGWGAAAASWGTQEDSDEFAGAGEPPKVVSEVAVPEEDDDSWDSFPVEEEPAEGFAPTSSFSEAAGDKAETPVADAPATFESVLGMIDDVTAEEGTAEPSALLRTPGASRRPLSERYQDPLLATPPPLEAREPREPREPGDAEDYGEDPVPSDAGGWRVVRSTGVPADDEMDLVLRAFEAHAASDDETAALQGVSRVGASGQDPDGIEDLLGDAAESLDEGDDDEHPGGRPFTGLKGWAPQRTAAAAGAVPPFGPIGATTPASVVGDATPWPPGRDGDDEIGFGSPPWGGEAAFESSEGDRGGTRARTIVREIVETGLLALLVFLAVRASFQNFRVEGQSMEPTLADGEFLIVNKLVYSEVDMDRLSKFVPFLSADPGEKRHVFHGPDRGDVIVFRDPRNPDEDLIKRVIGLPGEKVEIVNGVVYINEMPLEEPYIETRWDGNKEARIIPADEYFVLGDNRSNSLDSRSEQIGLVHKDLIIGKAMLAYWPSDKFASTLSEKPECRPDPNCVSVAATGSAALPR